MAEQALEHHEEEANDRTLFGFWIYLMTDLLMFGVLFAVYAVLHNSTFGGETAKDLFSLPLALAETIILLTSSFTVGIAMLMASQNKKMQTLIWFNITFALGLAFLLLEVNEFRLLYSEGHTLHSNAFMSSYFALVGTHGLHITAGLLWMGITMAYVIKRGLNGALVRKLSLVSLFWHFLDIVWIFIFTVVYLRTFI